MHRLTNFRDDDVEPSLNSNGRDVATVEHLQLTEFGLPPILRSQKSLAPRVAGIDLPPTNLSHKNEIFVFAAMCSRAGALFVAT